MDFNALVAALVAHPAAAIAALQFVAIGYLFRQLMATQKDALDLALKIAPLADSLSKAVDTAERIILHSKGPQ